MNNTHFLLNTIKNLPGWVSARLVTEMVGNFQLNTKFNMYVVQPKVNFYLNTLKRWHICARIYLNN